MTILSVLELRRMPDRLTRVEFTNLDKILYPELKITKTKIIEYYIKMALRILEFLAKRPVVLTRFPDGIDKEGFYEKDAPMGTPSWVETFRVYSENAKRYINYVICNDLDTLVWLANLAALELHMTLSGVENFDRPDFVLFDMDPQPPADIDEAVEAALLLKKKLDALDLTSYVKTSGKRGLHVVVPVKREYTFSQTRDFVHRVGKELAKDIENVVPEAKFKMPGKVLVDYAQNSHGKTMICPYSLRASSQGTVSTPLPWHWVKKGLNPREYNVFSVVKIDENPWKGILGHRQKLEVF